MHIQRYNLSYKDLNIFSLYGLDSKVLSDVRKICGNPEYTPKSANDLCNHLLVTCYMGTENSSKETKERASQLAAAIGR